MEVFRIVLLLGIAILTGLEAKRCVQVDLCSCQFDDDGTTVDITSLGNNDSTPRFEDVLAEGDGNFFSYNPCVGFTEGNCSDAAVCIINADKSDYVQIGDSGKAGFEYNEDSGITVVAYSSGNESSLRFTEVLLVCDPNACEPSFVANGQKEGGEFQLTLTTVCACPDGCTVDGPYNCTSAGGSAGIGGDSVFVIMPALCLPFVFAFLRDLF